MILLVAFAGNIYRFGDRVSISNYSNNLGTAINSIGYSTHRTIEINTTVTLAADANVPSNIALNIGENGSIVFGNYGLIIHGDFICAPGNQAFSYTGTGVVTFGTGRVKEVYSEWWGATGDGSTDDYTPFLAAATAYKNLALVPNSSYMIKSSVTIPDRITNIYGNDAILLTDSNHPILLHTHHGKLLTVRDTTFDGTAPGIKFLAAVSGTQYFDFNIENCTFIESAGVYGIHLDGGREGSISKCYFETCDGIYRTKTCNTYVINCQWKNTAYGINDDGDNTAYSCGLSVIGGIALGCTTWLRSYCTDDTSVYNNMIDYCDSPIIFKGVDESRICNNRISGRLTTPNIYISDSNIPSNCYNPIIAGNTFVGYSTDPGFDDIYISNAQKPIISNNNISFYTRYGINYTNCTYLKIIGNNISPRSGYGSFSVFTTDSSSMGNEITFNTLEQDPNVRQYLTKIIGNTGFTTEAKGETTIAAYDTYVDVAHGCEYTPRKLDISVTPTSSLALAAKFWISAIDGTNLRIEVDRDPNTAIGFAWQINKISGY